MFVDATLVKEEHGDLPLVQVAEHDLERLLGKYLRSLQTGGHHVLFCPPEFDDDEFRPPIYFSLVSSSTRKSFLKAIHKFTVAMINGYLSLLWYTCAFIVRERSQGGGKGPWWDDTTSLAEYRTWLGSERGDGAWCCYLKFGMPRVQILCAREVILLFTLTEVSFSHEELGKDGDM